MDKALVGKFLFPAPRPSYGEDSFPEELVWVPLYRDEKEGSLEYSFPCLLFACGTARYLLLYFHRNAEDLGMCRRFCESIRDQLYIHVLAVEYPGYGPQPCGTASAEQATRHAFAAFNFVRRVLRWPRDSIIVFGCSVGTGVAVALAEKEDVAGVVLVAPFLSVKAACRDRIGPMLTDLITEQFPNDQIVSRIRSPTLIVHGQKDMVIPYCHGEQLYERFRCKKALISPYGLDHNTCLLRNEWFLLRPMLNFFSLPDYSFEHMTVPAWAFSKPQPGEVPQAHDPTYFPGPVHESAPVPEGIKRLGETVGLLDEEDFDDAAGVVPPDNDKPHLLVPKTPQVKNQLLDNPVDKSSKRAWWCHEVHRCDADREFVESKYKEEVYSFPWSVERTRSPKSPAEQVTV